MWMERLNPNGYNEMWWDMMMIDMRWVSNFGNMGFGLRKFETELKWNGNEKGRWKYVKRRLLGFMIRVMLLVWFESCDKNFKWMYYDSIHVQRLTQIKFGRFILKKQSRLWFKSCCNYDLNQEEKIWINF